MLRRDYLNILDRYGQMGLEALRGATPTDTGKTAESWQYGIEKGDGLVTLYWENTNVNDGVTVAILLLYGHGLQNGGYVEGVDYVSPVMRPLFQKMAEESWKEVTKP